MKSENILWSVPKNIAHIVGIQIIVRYFEQSILDTAQREATLVEGVKNCFSNPLIVAIDVLTTTRIEMTVKYTTTLSRSGPDT